MAIDYNNNVIRHFLEPVNAGVIDDPDGIGKIGDMSCGDMIVMYIKVNEDIISDIKYQVFGCAAAIATCSALTEIGIGKSIEDALAITDDEIIIFLGGLPLLKMHCSTGAADALHTAIADYLTRQLTKE